MAPFFAGLPVGLYAEERLRDARHQTFEFERCIRDREADAIFGNVSDRRMVQIFAGHFDIASPEVTAFVLKRALEHESQFKTVMPVIRDCGACRDIEQTGRLRAWTLAGSPASHPCPPNASVHFPARRRRNPPEVRAKHRLAPWLTRACPEPDCLGRGSCPRQISKLFCAISTLAQVSRTAPPTAS